MQYSTRLAALLVGVGLLGSVAIARDRASAEPALSSPEASSSQELLRSWEPGALRSYSVTLRQQTSLSNAAATGAGNDLQVTAELRGGWSMWVVGRPEQRVVRGVLEPKSLSLLSDSRQLTESQRSQLTAELSRPFFAVFDEHGQVSEAYYEAETSEDARGFLRCLLAAMQYTPLPATGASWQAAERDPAGSFIAEYRRASTLSLTRRRSRFTDAQQGAEKRPSGHTQLSLAPDGWPTRLEAKEGVAFSLSYAKLRSTAKLEVELQLSQVGRDPSLVGSFDAARAGLSREIGWDANRAALARQADAQAVSGHSFKALAQDLARSAGDRGLAREQAEASSKLAANLRLEPDLATDVGLRLKSAEIPEAKLLLSALSDAGTRQAEAALASAADDADLDEALRSAALDHLGGVAEPTDASINTLRSAMDSESKAEHAASTLAYGRAARRSAGSGSRMTKDLMQRLERATTAAEKVLLLEALGNSRSPQLLGVARGALKDPSSAVRGAAAFALRFLTDSASEELLLSALADAEVPVRRRAITAFGYRPVTKNALASFGLILERDQSAQVRLDAVVRLSAWLRGNFEEDTIRAALKWAATQDPDAEVQRAASAALEGN